MLNCKIIARTILLFLLHVFFVPANAADKDHVPATSSISPYLAYHETDLVHWLPWNENTLQQAKQSQKLILISSGYYACHYCHIMKRESYENREIADYINKHFIPVLIDREIHTALDTQLMAFMGEIGASQGWPLQVILTPDAHPMIGTSYRPATEFLQFLEQVQKLWRDDRTKWTQLGKQATEKMVQKLTVPAYRIQSNKSAQFLESFYEQTLLVADREHGGFGFAAKFPLSPQLLVLLRLQEQHPNDELKQHLNFTLKQMARSGLADVLGGGFFRYATEREWRQPHYEKMLYDNVQLAQVYLEAATILNEPYFREVAERTLNFLLREFSDNRPGFVSSLSAVDDHGVDGGYYLWSATELKALLLPKEYEVISHVWPIVSGEGETGYYFPGEPDDVNSHAATLSMTQMQLLTLLASAKKKIFESQQQRHLLKDIKRIAGWNGLALMLFSRAAKVMANERYQRGADELYRFIANELWRDGHLWRTAEGGNAELADYAYVAAGLLEYARLSNKDAYYDLCIRVTSQAWQRFFVEGVWSSTDNIHLLLPFTVYQATLPDNELPSPTAMLIVTTLGVQNTVDASYRDMAHKALYTVDANFLKSPFFYATQIHTMVTNDAFR